VEKEVTEMLPLGLICILALLFCCVVCLMAVTILT